MQLLDLPDEILEELTRYDYTTRPFTLCCKRLREIALPDFFCGLYYRNMTICNVKRAIDFTITAESSPDHLDSHKHKQSLVKYVYVEGSVHILNMLMQPNQREERLKHMQSIIDVVDFFRSQRNNSAFPDILRSKVTVATDFIDANFKPEDYTAISLLDNIETNRVVQLVKIAEALSLAVVSRCVSQLPSLKEMFVVWILDAWHMLDAATSWQGKIVDLHITNCNFNDPWPVNPLHVLHPRIATFHLLIPQLKKLTIFNNHAWRGLSAAEVNSMWTLIDNIEEFSLGEWDGRGQHIEFPTLLELPACTRISLHDPLTKTTASRRVAYPQSFKAPHLAYFYGPFGLLSALDHAHLAKLTTVQIDDNLEQSTLTSLFKAFTCLQAMSCQVRVADISVEEEQDQILVLLERLPLSIRSFTVKGSFRNRSRSPWPTNQPLDWLCTVRHTNLASLAFEGFYADREVSRKTMLELQSLVVQTLHPTLPKLAWYCHIPLWIESDDSTDTDSVDIDSLDALDIAEEN